MDEPFAALDVQTRKMLYKEVLKIHQETNKTILFCYSQYKRGCSFRR